MLPAVWAALVEAGPVVLLPATMVIGYIGYKVEGYVTRNRKENQAKSIIVSYLFFRLIPCEIAMWYVAAWNTIVRFSPKLLLPVTMVIGTIGVWTEEKIRKNQCDVTKSISVSSSQ